MPLILTNYYPKKIIIKKAEMMLFRRKKKREIVEGHDSSLLSCVYIFICLQLIIGERWKVEIMFEEREEKRALK